MRIMIFSNSYAPMIGGLEISIELFRQGLIEAGHDVHLVVPEYDDYADKEPYIFRLPAMALPGEVGFPVAAPFKAPIATTVRGIKPVLIHSQHPFWVGDLAATFAQDLAIPLVFTFHTRYKKYTQEYISIASELMGNVTQEIVARYLKKCTHIVAPTVSIQEFILEEYAPAAPVTVVPTPVDLSGYDKLDPQHVRTEWGLQDTEVLLYVGRLAKEKNLGFLLHAFARIATTRPQTRLLLVGSGAEKDALQEQTRKLDLDKQVIFTGAVHHEAVPNYAAAADLFVFSSVTETQGMVLTEAMAAGTPVVAVEAPGPVDILAEGGGVLVPQQEQAFAEAVLALLSDRSRLRTMGERASEVAHGYAIPEATASLLSIYEAAIAEGPRKESPTA